MGVPLPEQPDNDYNYENENDFRRTSEQVNLLEHFESIGTTPTISNWLQAIKDAVEISVQEVDDGDRDNLMYNVEFAKHFLRLCKLLPLWSAISCKIFGSPSVSSSSANVESYFKDVKHTLKDTLPSTADVFVQRHIDSIDDLIITASQKYAGTIGPKIVPISMDLDLSPNDEQHEVIDGRSSEEDINDNNNNTDAEDGLLNESNNLTACIVCRDGNFPSDAHTCIDCKKNVHIISGCSFPIGSQEGYGSKRICVACHEEKRKMSQAQDAAEMNFEEQWAKKPKTKRSAYMKPNPAFNIMSETKQQKIGLLKNGNLAKQVTKVNKKAVQFTSTCAFDALVQALAGAYAYHPMIRPHFNESDELMNIAISLAKK